MPAAERAPFVALLVNFTAVLRAAGLPVGSGDVLAYCAAVGALDPTDLVDLYWGGRTTLVTRRENIGVYDRVFRRFFLGTNDPVRELLKLRQPERTRAEGVLQIPATDPGEDLQEQVSLGLMASDAETLAGKGVAAVNRLREMELAKPPGVAETIDWVRTLDFLGETGLGTEVAGDTLGAVIKERDDLEMVRDNLEEITSGA